MPKIVKPSGLLGALQQQGLKEIVHRTWKTRPEVLLCANIPKPLYGVAPRVVLGAKWWNATRQASYKSTDYHCVACGVHKTSARSRQWLEGHELYKIDYQRGRMTYIETVPLCHYCHNYIHDGRMRDLLTKGLLHQSKYVAIIQHGDRVLQDAGLTRLTYEEREQKFLLMELEGSVAPWHKWRLVIGRKVYPPKFKTLKEWQAFHNHTKP